MKNLGIFGATGSIGQSTLAVVREHPEEFRVVVLTARSQQQKLAELIEEFQPAIAVIEEKPADELASVAQRYGTQLKVGRQALLDAADESMDMAMHALVGAAGLELALRLATKPMRLCLANKESIVCGGHLLHANAARSGCHVMPVDSEHNAIYQLLEGKKIEDVARITITASGGPFRDMPLGEFTSITPAQAVKHPNWSMGAKISVDSATMMNKGLELIEAAYFFPVAHDQLQAVIHPQSIIHGLIEMVDGSCLAHLSETSMQVPIRYAMAVDARLSGGQNLLDIMREGELALYPVDERRYPCFGLARQALAHGGGAPNILNAANEVAVGLFLSGHIGFLDIPALVDKALGSAELAQWLASDCATVGEVLELDAATRQLVRQWVKKV